jgi:hypothetical protein
VKSRYLSLEPGFEKVSDGVAGDKQFLGWLAFFNRLAPRYWKFSYVFAVWVLRIRSNAFLLAEILADPSNKPSRSLFENTLLTAVIKRQSVAIDESLSPFWWLRKLGIPPVPMFVSSVVIQDVSLSVLLVLLCLVSIIVMEYVYTLKATHLLGRETLAAVLDASVRWREERQT